MSKYEEMKIILLGNSSVGKTSFIVKYIDNKFSFDYTATLGIDYKLKKLKSKKGKEIRLRIFDTAGQERFKSVSVSFIKKADGIVLIYDISNKISFEEIGGWIESIKENGKINIPVILVGNKCDLSDDIRQISKKEGQEKADEFQIPFYETSCKDGININEVFDKLVQNIQNSNYSSGETKVLNAGNKNKKCC